jgi:indole-3-acetate monooxygenase
MQLHADSTLVEAARRIAPVIREYNQESERERRLSPPVLSALHETGLLRMCTPRSLGGLEADPLTRALVIEEISAHDTAAGWTLANPLTGRISAPGCRTPEQKKFTAAAPTS